MEMSQIEFLKFLDNSNQHHKQLFNKIRILKVWPKF